MPNQTEIVPATLEANAANEEYAGTQEELSPEPWSKLTISEKAAQAEIWDGTFSVVLEPANLGLSFIGKRLSNEKLGYADGSGKFVTFDRAVKDSKAGKANASIGLRVQRAHALAHWAHESEVNMSPGAAALMTVAASIVQALEDTQDESTGKADNAGDGAEEG